MGRIKGNLISSLQIHRGTTGSKAGLGRCEECYECFRTLPPRNRPISTVSGSDVNGHPTSTCSGARYQRQSVHLRTRKVSLNNKRTQSVLARSINFSTKIIYSLFNNNYNTWIFSHRVIIIIHNCKIVNNVIFIFPTRFIHVNHRGVILTPCFNFIFDRLD